MNERPTGLTKDAGWEVGVSRTLPVEPSEVWEYLLSPDGLSLWLGEGVSNLEKGSSYTTADGITGEVRSLHPGERVRMTWQPSERDGDATVQIAVRESANGSTLTFHTERLASETEREQMRGRWQEVLDRLEGELGAT